VSEPFISEIRIFGLNFAPRGWAMCNGQIMSIAQNTALFSLLGTTYGGNGQTTFALPNLQGRVPIHEGQGPGLSSYVLGEEGGQENVTLTQQQMPQHSHLVQANGGAGTSTRPDGNVLAKTGANAYAAAPDGTAMNAGEIAPIVQPFLVLNFCIALEGIFPSRN
jgi:microcystin-dependent protein